MAPVLILQTSDKLSSLIVPALSVDTFIHIQHALHKHLTPSLNGFRLLLP